MSSLKVAYAWVRHAAVVTVRTIVAVPPLLSLIIALGGANCATKGKPTGDPPASAGTTVEWGDLVSAELVGRDTPAELLRRYPVQGLDKFAKYPVDAYRLTYRTPDPAGNVVVASGLMLIPRRDAPLSLLCYTRGTILPAMEKTSPSYYPISNNNGRAANEEISYAASALAAAGYLTVAPDLIGYGASLGHPHPYCHTPTLSSTARDLLRAARALARSRGLSLTGRVFIAGWSEGALTGMALHRDLQQNLPDEFDVRASSLLAGPYAIRSTIELFIQYDEPFPESNLYYWAIQTFNTLSGPDRPLNHLVSDEAAATLAADVTAAVPLNPRQVLRPDFRRGIIEGTDKQMRTAFAQHDCFDWTPIRPVFLHQGTADDIVPFFNAQITFERMRKRGGQVALIPYLAQDHFRPMRAYILRTLANFESLDF